MKPLEHELPIPAELTEQLGNLSATQKAFLAGYLWAASQSGVAETAPAAAASRKITVLSASQTGNAAGVAKQLAAALTAAQLDASLVSAGSYKARQLSKEDILLMVTSTQGEGDPPEEAVPLHHALFGKKAPTLDGVSFAVFGLGDTSYPDFNQAGIDFDSKFAELGGERLLDRVDADVDYQAAADAWIELAVTRLKDIAGAVGTAPSTAANVDSVAATTYTKGHPYTASLLQCHSLVTDDADKEVVHVEVDLADSGIQYQPGDSLGIVTHNDPELVTAILTLVDLTGEEQVDGRNGPLTLREALRTQADLNQLTPKFLEDYASTAGNATLSELVADREQLQDFLAATSLVELLREYPQSVEAQRLYGGLKPLVPRLYSIASAQQEVGEEVHLCVSVVDIPVGDDVYFGSASGLLSKRLEEGDEVGVFVEPNANFRLPRSPDTPIIMIGAGTGVAPYRAFLQQRGADGAEGRNWLIFGNKHYRRDFLYQAEWLEYRDQGLLPEISLAWSRDGAAKIYVQDRIREAGEQFWQWLGEGAHIYVCGDATRMAKDVDKAILDVIAQHGGMSEDDAADYLNDLREADRYQRDVY